METLPNAVTVLGVMLLTLTPNTALEQSYSSLWVL